MRCWSSKLRKLLRGRWMARAKFRDFLRYLAQTRVSSVDAIPGDTDALTLTELDAALREMRESGEAYREFVKAKATQFGPNP